MLGLKTHPDIVAQIQHKALDSNSHILSDVELDAAHTSIGIAVQNIHFLSGKIDQLTQAISRLRAQQDAAQEILRRLQVALAPIKNIPREILAEIFVHTLEGKSITLPTKPHDIHPPWALLRVCSLWRHVTRGEKRLWSHVMVHVDASLQNDANLKSWNHHIANGLEELIFSRCDNISFRFISSGSLEHKRQTNYSLQSLLVPCLPRLKELILRLPAETTSTFYNLPPEAFACIESMSVISDYEIYIETSPADQQIFRHAPVFDKVQSLRKFTLRSSWYYFVLPERLPWSQLLDVEVSLASWELREMLDVLRACVNARRCDFGSLSIDRREHLSLVTAGPITLPHLRHLGLRNFNNVVLDYVVLPSLTSLHLESRWDIDFEPELIVSMIERSGCTLQALSYNSQSKPKPNISRVLRARNRASFEMLLSLVPSLCELRMPYIAFLPPTLELIAHGQLLPALTVLECNIWWNDTPHFVDLVEQRLHFPSSRSLPSDPERTLWEAIGHYVLHPKFLGGTLDAHKRIDELREVHNKRLNLVRRWSP